MAPRRQADMVKVLLAAAVLVLRLPSKTADVDPRRGLFRLSVTIAVQRVGSGVLAHNGVDSNSHMHRKLRQSRNRLCCPPVLRLAPRTRDTMTIRGGRGPALAKREVSAQRGGRYARDSRAQTSSRAIMFVPGLYMVSHTFEEPTSCAVNSTAPGCRIITMRKVCPFGERALWLRTASSGFACSASALDAVNYSIRWRLPDCICNLVYDDLHSASITLIVVVFIFLSECREQKNSELSDPVPTPSPDCPGARAESHHEGVGIFTERIFSAGSSEWSSSGSINDPQVLQNFSQLLVMPADELGHPEYQSEEARRDRIGTTSAERCNRNAGPIRR